MDGRDCEGNEKQDQVGIRENPFHFIRVLGGETKTLKKNGKKMYSLDLKTKHIWCSNGKYIDGSRGVCS